MKMKKVKIWAILAGFAEGSGTVGGPHGEDQLGAVDGASDIVSGVLDRCETFDRPLRGYPAVGRDCGDVFGELFEVEHRYVVSGLGPIEGYCRAAGAGTQNRDLHVLDP